MTCIGLIMETVSAMVSSVDLSTRINSTKLALKAIKEQEDSSASTSSPRTAILDSYGIDTSPSSTNTRLTQLLAQYAQVSGTDAETDDTSTQAPSGDVTQASFMTSLKATLEELSKDPSKATQAKAMLEALAAGTLTVSDPTEGAKIKAWDVEADKTTTSKPATEITTTGWSDFLKDHLKRDGSAYAKTTGGAYVDSISGDNAFFGNVGSRYYYLTWPQAKTGTLTV
ncbi:conserved hypothetical protein [Agrobacterium fabacearum CFBP 5771]|uniref:hypothetical protein n=1 Tax=Rhizobium/Agrobacterium group TaxID=227290 RepID=UPI00054FF3EB|nr:MULTISPECIES: hypothetical protein [Rhizobium/Agrobacterium group]KAA3507115.1 hypothetical protein DXM26_07885 [Agrobacterium tumefaciens]KQY53068.1 hypothetical protein ASD46_01030 [Rhizobium sp. Root491]MDR5008529.1 hypothetical protein [Agrobacterium tumefaciens]NSY58280.1 hypothetical protein [Agrobacterium tumefaciens]NTZ59753.1 hypothetical protein [Agrobacterium tumefaciens]